MSVKDSDLKDLLNLVLSDLPPVGDPSEPTLYWFTHIYGWAEPLYAKPTRLSKLKRQMRGFWKRCSRAWDIMIGREDEMVDD